MKFLVDAMLGKLARLLRIFGYDTVYAEEVEKSAPDLKLLDYSIKNNRIIITRDLPFHKKAKDHSIYLDGTDAYENLLKLEKELNLKLDFSMNNARCSKCNSLLEKVKDKKSIINQIESDTFQNYEYFYMCLNPKCKKIYWKGSHIDKIFNKLKKKA
ncbi:MAG: DUF5615 family PIN-like protein [Promethearchaeota archaeon]